MSKTIEEIRSIVATDQGYDSWEHFLEWEDADDVAFHFAIEYSNQQTQELTAWKESASKVFKNLDLQAIGKTLGIGLGEDVSVNVLPKIKELQEHNAELISFLQLLSRKGGLGLDVHEKIDNLLTKYSHLKSNTNE